MTLRQFMEQHNSLMGDYVYHMNKVNEAARKYVKRNLLMGFYLWQMHHHRRKAVECLIKNKELERLYFKEHFNYELGA